MVTSRRHATDRRRPALALPLAGMLAAAGLVAATAAPAAAAAEVDTLAELRAAVGTPCGSGPAQVVLAGDISEPAAQVAMPCDADLDLNGHDLTVRNIVIDSEDPIGTVSVTIDDDTGTPGTLTADASGTGHQNGTTIYPGVAGIETRYYTTLTIDGGTVVAKGGYDGAGVGGGDHVNASNITISGTADVTAIGGYSAAGIGGGLYGSASNITVTDSAHVVATGGISGAGIGSGNFGRDCRHLAINGAADVTAAGGASGAGIGAGRNQGGCDVTVSGSAHVSATGGSGAAGIGGGWDGDGGSVTIGVDAAVTASGGSTAVGSGAPFSGTDAFGSLKVDGTLQLPSGQMRVQDSNASGPEVTVGPQGTIEGGSADPTAGAQLTGGGQVHNGGAVLLAANLVTGDDGAPVTVTDRHYLVSFDTQGGSANPAAVTVFGPSFTAGDRDFPPDPSFGTSTFAGWNTETDGSGTDVDADTDLTALGSSTDGAPFAVPLYAQWDGTPAGGEIDTIGEVQAAVGAPCPSGSTDVVLAGDISDPAAEVVVACDVDLDLNGHDLTVRDISIDPGKTLTIDDSTGTSGSLTADAGDSGKPGITTTGATIIIDGGTVIANGGHDAAGIGGGADGDGGAVDVGVGANVTAAGGYTAVGSGKPGSGAGSFGSLRVDGTLRLPSGQLRVQDSNTTGPEVTVGATGVIRGGSADPTDGAQLTGGGQVDNGGTVVLASNLVTGGSTPVTVTRRHFLVSFDTQGGSANPPDVAVFATSFTTGQRGFPPDPTRAGHTFLGWNAAPDGSGAVVDATTDLVPFGSSTDGVAVPVPLYAQWDDVSSDVEVDSIGEVKNAVATPCADDVRNVVLTDDISDPAAQVPIACDVDLDLNGHDLTVRNVTVGPDRTLTIDDSTGTPGTLTANASRAAGIAGIGTAGATMTVDGGTVVAHGGYLAAGIGGGWGGDGSAITIEGSADVSATGGFGGAGIGGGWGGDGSAVTVEGSADVSATGGFGGAGVGGGYAGDGTAIAIDGSATASGGFGAAGIGGGFTGDGSDITVGASAEVTATGGFGGAGIGGGWGGDGGDITVDGSAEVTATGGFGGVGIGSA